MQEKVGQGPKADGAGTGAAEKSPKKHSIEEVIDAVSGATWNTRNRIMEDLFKERIGRQRRRHAHVRPSGILDRKRTGEMGQDFGEQKGTDPLSLLAEHQGVWSFYRTKEPAPFCPFVLADAVPFKT